MTSEIDALVIGGRIAGAVVARRLAEGGALVWVTDRSTLDRPVLSSGFLWPPGVRDLQGEGVLEAIRATHPELRAWRSFTDDHAEEYRPDWTSPGYCLNPARTLLDAVLVGQAKLVQRWCWGWALDTVEQGSQRRWTIGIKARDGRRERVECDWIVGADGRRSAVAAACGRGWSRTHQPYRTWVVGLVSGWRGPSDTVVAGFTGKTWIGASPTMGGCTLSVSFPSGVAGALRRDLVSVAAMAPAMRGFLTGATCKHVLMTSSAGSHIADNVWGQGWVLAGDAALATEPISATGISFALRSAAKAADVVLGALGSGDSGTAGVDYDNWLERIGTRLLDDIGEPHGETEREMPRGCSLSDQAERWHKRIRMIDEALD